MNVAKEGELSMKILIGVDESTFSTDAVQAVAKRPWVDGTQVRLVSVVEGPTQFEAGLENEYKTARTALDEAIEVLRQSSNKFEVTCTIAEGTPKQVILDEAESWGADLIVVGSHGRRGLDRFLLGSVSQAVALHARCSVEIVRVPRV